jgi:hypothetical protein
MYSSNPAGLFQPNREGRHAVYRLQRVLWRDEPPDLVEAEVFEREQADVQMPAMGRVERATQQPDPAVPEGARRILGEAAQGRTCPLPRTRYL